MWPSISFEECAWDRDDSAFGLLSRNARRKITGTYTAAVVPEIADCSVEGLIPLELSLKIADVRAKVAAFDARQAARGYDLPALMLRSESSSSSQIERLTSSVRNVALAEVCDMVPRNAALIAGNVAAMRTALLLEGGISTECIVRIHDVLMANTDEARGLRTEQVWIGGTPYSPHGAIFVPPHESRVAPSLADLCRFAAREDIDPLVKAALFHAQFETIHPFTDGNGRCGRAIMHRMLALDGVLSSATLPVSSGLLHDVDRYMGALERYHSGEATPIVECVVDALESALVVGTHTAEAMDTVMADWKARITERTGSSIHRLPALLAAHPVVNVALVAQELSITNRAAQSLVASACEKGILKKMGNAKRGAYYQAPDLIAVLEEAAL